MSFTEALQNVKGTFSNFHKKKKRESPTLRVYCKKGQNQDSIANSLRVAIIRIIRD